MWSQIWLFLLLISLRYFLKAVSPTLLNFREFNINKTKAMCKMLLKSLGLKPSLHKGVNKECNLTWVKYRRLLTIRVKVHTLFIVKHLWYTCIALCKVLVLFFKAVASFCGKDGDCGHVDTPTLCTFFDFLPYTYHKKLPLYVLAKPKRPQKVHRLFCNQFLYLAVYVGAGKCILHMH